MKRIMTDSEWASELEKAYLKGKKEALDKIDDAFEQGWRKGWREGFGYGRGFLYPMSSGTFVDLSQTTREDEKGLYELWAIEKNED